MKSSQPTSDRLAIVLAAGRGTRMQSDLPKVLCPVLGRAMIHWVLDALEKAGFKRCVVVVGYRAADVEKELCRRPTSDAINIDFAVQAQQLGTGHAVQMCAAQLRQHEGPVLVVAGDSPMIQATSISKLVDAFEQGDYACLLGTLLKDNPQGLGRIVRDQAGQFERIVEQKDASPAEDVIKEVNMSIYLFQSKALQGALEKLSNTNAQGEFYLTDCPAILLKQGQRVDALPVLKACESLSINTPSELAVVEAEMKKIGYAVRA